MNGEIELLSRKAAPLENQSATSPYEERLAEAEAHLRLLEPKSLRMSWYRGALFLAATAAFLAHSWLKLDGFSFAAAASAVFALGFVLIVAAHRNMLRQINRWKGWAAISQEGKARMERRWDALQHIIEPTATDRRELAADLDILGRASLYRLTGGAYTETGKKKLASRLLCFADRDEIAFRQALTAELRPQTELMMEYRLLVHGLEKKPSDPAPFLQWAASDPWLAGHKKVLWAARGLSLVPAFLGLAQVLGFVEFPYWLFAMVINLAFGGLYAAKMHKIFDAVSLHKGGIEYYSSLFEFMSGLKLTSDEGRLLQSKLAVGNAAAHEQMKRLERISSFADLRFSAMMYFPIQMLTLIDFHVLSQMERWQVNVGRHAKEWLDALGELEASIGIATFAHDNPNYPFPDISAEKSPKFIAKGMGHPLLNPRVAVTNEVNLGGPGEFLLVTGSNMSGKSSHLRSIGLNAAMTSAGGAVFAEALTMSPCVLGTSFRVVDSISDGVSFFMAELLRLKEIVSRAEEGAEIGPPLLFLLDEILQGTNIIERRIAVTNVLKHLVRHGCIGAISSHDLTLADADGIQQQSRTVHFRESFRDGRNGREMYFEYILHPGLAPTTNALELLRMVGL
jgi:hypothetical protein